MKICIYSEIARTFWDMYDDIKQGGHSEYWIKGGRGSTKSSFISIAIVRGILADPLANAIVYRRVGGTVRDSVFNQILWAIDRLGLRAWFQTRVSPYEIIYRRTGQRILFRGADDPVKSKSLKLTRGYFRYLWFEELTEFRGMEDIRSIKQSVFRGVEHAITFYSYNPPQTARNWVNQAVLEPSDRRFIHHSTYLDVPRQWLGDAFYSEAEAVERTNPRAYQNEYLGEVTGTGGQVFDNLDIREISDEEITAFDRFYNGLDFGFAVDPDAFIRAAYVPNTRRLYLLDEYYSAHVPTDTLANAVKSRAGREIVTCDCAEPRMVRELRSRGVNALGAKKGAGSREHGYRWLQNLGAIVADPKRTPNAVRELTAYEYLRDRNGNFYSAYPDGNDHTLDALRYATEALSANRVARTSNF